MTTAEVEELKRRERAAEAALREARDIREKAEASEREGRLAWLMPLVIRAHDLLCAWNHTDGCSWGYECRGGQHAWGGWAHARWLQHYEGLVTRNNRYVDPLTADELGAMLDGIEALRKTHPRAVTLLRHGLTP